MDTFVIDVLSRLLVAFFLNNIFEFEIINLFCFDFFGKGVKDIGGVQVDRW